MTELEQLRAELATLEKANNIAARDHGYSPIFLEELIRQRRAKIAELDNELRCERVDGGKVRDDRKAISAERLREKLAELTMILNSIPPACGMAMELVKRRIESVKKEMQGKETTDGLDPKQEMQGKVTTDELDPRRVLATARDVLRHYSKFISSDDGWNTRNLQQAINTIDFMAGTEAEPLKWEKQPHQSELEKAEKEIQGNGN